MSAPVTTHRRADRESLALSDSVTVTLTLEGPAPLRIEPPARWLSEESAAVWKVASASPAKVEAIPDGRERWTITLRVDPFLPGESLPLQFATAKVTAGADVAAQSVSWDGLEFRVETSLDAKTATPRPITGIEPVPEVIISPIAMPLDRVSIAFGLLVFAVVLLVIARIIRRSRVPVDPVAASLRELERLRSVPEPGRVLDRVVQVSRAFLERRSGIRATHLTAEEFAIASKDVPDAAEWQTLFEQCDARRFAGETLTRDEALAAIDMAMRLISLAQPPRSP